MRSRTFIAAVMVSAALSPFGQVLAQAPVELSAEQVRDSIRQGVDYLLNEQSGRGTWDDMNDYPGGVTALTTLALLNAGVEPSHPKIQKALTYLRALEPN